MVVLLPAAAEGDGCDRSYGSGRGGAAPEGEGFDQGAKTRIRTSATKIPIGIIHAANINQPKLFQSTRQVSHTAALSGPF